MKKKLSVMLLLIAIVPTTLYFLLTKPGSKDSLISQVREIFKPDEGTLSSDGLKKYVVNMDNGLLKKKELGDIVFAAKYKPVDYIIAKESNDKPITAKEYKEKRQELDGLQYFDLRIELKEGDGELLKHNLSRGSEYNERVDYYAFNIIDDLKLVDGKDTLNCVMHHFERVYDIVPYATILIAFDDKNWNMMSEKTIIYNDKIFGKGLVKFTFLPADLQIIPKLEVVS